MDNDLGPRPHAATPADRLDPHDRLAGTLTAVTKVLAASIWLVGLVGAVFVVFVWFDYQAHYAGRDASGWEDVALFLGLLVGSASLGLLALSTVVLLARRPRVVHGFALLLALWCGVAWWIAGAIAVGIYLGQVPGLIPAIAGVPLAMAASSLTALVRGSRGA